MKGYEKPSFKVADVFRMVPFGEIIGPTGFSMQQQKTARSIIRCRTPQMGGHIQACGCCGHTEMVCNSCRDRHCPNCGGMKREKWLLERKQDILPVKHYHVVFTLPHMLNNVCNKYQKEMYNLLFRSAWGTIKSFGLDPKYLGADTGMLAVLHTWGQDMKQHNHLHCMVPEGGVTQQNQWRAAKKANKKFLFPVKALAKTFRGKFVDGLIKLVENRKVQMSSPPTKGDKAAHPLYKQKWVVYAKAPVAGTDQITEYLGRYISKVAISDHRILDIGQHGVCFKWKDYRDNKTKTMTLDHFGFVSRFLMHVLPPGFVKVRYYGILSCRKKLAAQLAVCICLSKNMPHKQELGNWQEVYMAAFGKEPLLCPKCKKGRYIVVACFKPIRDGPVDMAGILGQFAGRVA